MIGDIVTSIIKIFMSTATSLANAAIQSYNNWMTPSPNLFSPNEHQLFFNITVKLDKA